MSDAVRANAREDAGRPEAERARIREHGALLVMRLFGVLRGLRLYDAGNRALRTLQQDLIDALEPLAGDDDATLIGAGDYLYVDGVRLRPNIGQVAVFHHLLDEFEQRSIGGLRFARGLTVEELAPFLRAFHATRGEDAAERIDAALAEAGVRHIGTIVARGVAVDAAFADTELPGHDADAHRVRLEFSRAMGGVHELMHQAARHGRPSLRHARRVVQPLVDRLLRREHSLIGLTALKRHDEYTYAHCVNVSILSIRMGQVLGLSRGDLANLGVAALLHDTGKVTVAADVLCKPGKLEPEEWDAIRRHPVEGLRIVSRFPGLSALMVDSMRVAFEHHMNTDHSGYPPIRSPRPMGAFSRIVAVADCFDAVTAHRAYRKRPMTAHEALRLLVGRERHHFDPAVLWALVHTVGLYPPGTLLRTASRRLWVAVAPHGDDPRRPVVREIRHGATLEPAPWDQNAPLPEDEAVTHVLSPDDVPVDVETLLTP